MEQLMTDKEIWEEVINRAVEKGRDKPTLSLLADPLGRAMIIQAIEDDRYRFEPPRTMYINKLTDAYVTYEQAQNLPKVRELFAPSNDMDAVVLAWATKIMFKKFGHEIDRKCMSYKKGTGVYNIIYESVIPNMKHGGYKMDISKYFDNVSQEYLDYLLNKYKTGHEGFDRLLWNLYHDDRVYLGKATEVSHRYMGLRQGCALATFFADVGLKDIDEMANKYDVYYVRYSDDILVLGKDSDKVLAEIEKMLKPKGLELNPSKIECIDPKKPFEFLGCKIYPNGTVDLGKKAVTKYKHDVKHICDRYRRTPAKGDDRRKLQKKAIREINKLTYAQSDKSYGFMPYWSRLASTDETIRMLDEYTKDHIKVIYTRKYIQTRFTAETSNDWLKENGYKSMVHMYRLRTYSKDLYEQELRKEF